MNSIRALFTEPTGRPRTIWRLFLGYLAMMITIGVLASLVDTVEIPFLESFLWQLLAAPALVGVAMLLSRVDRRPFAAYGLRWEPVSLLRGVLFGTAIALGLWALELALGWLQVTATLWTRYPVPFVLALLGFLARYAAVAVFEELFHRGFLITNLAEGLAGDRPRRGLALLLGSMIFGALHLTNEAATPAAALNVTLLGLLFGLPYVWTGSLSTSIGLHLGWNFALGPICGLPVSGYATRAGCVISEATGPEMWTGGSFGPEGGLLATIFLAGALGIAYANRSMDLT